MAPSSPEARPLRRIIALLTGLVLTLLVAVVFLVLTRGPGKAALRRQEAYFESRLEKIGAIVTDESGIFDNHVDGDVGPLLQPGTVGFYAGAEVASNRFGLRERRFEWRKPEGVVRVVLLGDSFVFGYGIGVQGRMGVHLEQALRARSGDFAGEIEVLHVAMTSWNIVAECAFLRRQLAELAPDLVVHVVVTNDLDDVPGARGFGALARFSPQVRGRADGLVAKNFRARDWGFDRAASTPLPYGLDHESRQRYAEAARRIGALARATKAIGGRYLLLSHFSIFTPLVGERLAPELLPEELAHLSYDFAKDDDLVNSAQDHHWNEDGHETVATLLYGLIQERGLLPMLDLEDWGDAAEAVEEIHGDARNREDPAAFLARSAESFSLRSELDFSVPDLENAAQVYAGIDAQGGAAPYASVILRNDSGRTLEVRGACFPRPEIAGGRARVFVEEHEVGTIPFADVGPFTRSWELPADVRARPFLNVRFESDDHVTIEPRNARCVAFDLDLVAVR